VVFREVGGKFEPEEVVQTENNFDTMLFELRNEEDDSYESNKYEEEVEQLNLVISRSETIRKPFERYSLLDFHSSFMLTTTDDEPKSISEAVDSIKGKLWRDVVVEEMESLYNNETWDLVELPSGRNPIGSKWVFKKKINVVGQVKKFKDRLVAKGYSQVKRVDFTEIFSSIAKLTSIRVLMSLVVEFDMEIEKMDVKKMFLHGDPKEEIYMKKDEGFVVKGKKELVCKLRRSLYGLKKSPRIWHQNFDTYILSLGFLRSKVDHCIYPKKEGQCFIYVSLYFGCC
jgi:hypothetical protein